MTTMLKAPPARKTLREPPVVKRAYLGSYMSFAGVNYFRLFEATDFAFGKTRIGPVGWHTPNE